MKKVMRILLFCAAAVVTFAFSRTPAATVVHHDCDVQWIIQWRGEGSEGYSTTLRQWEFTCAFKAEVAEYWNSDSSLIHGNMPLDDYLENIEFDFRDALKYQGPVFHPDTIQNQAGAMEGGEPIPREQIFAYESGVQTVIVNLPRSSPELVCKIFQYTIERCSLVRNGFLVVARGNSYEQLAVRALDYGSFNDMMKGGSNEDATWSIRLRRYGPEESVNNGDRKKRPNRQARYGKNVRSPLSDEKNAILAMKDLVKLFPGKVNLSNPDCKIYLFDGLKRADSESCDSTKCLARSIGKGPKTSVYAPKTRICVTTTPLCPIAAFSLCNVAQLRPDFMVLDPFAGSCASLLAATHIAKHSARGKKSQGGTVSIEFAHNGLVNRDDIVLDFETRSLDPPLKIIHGDCMLYETRKIARQAIGGGAFDCIVTDPPYGIREAMISSSWESYNSDGKIGGRSSLPPLTQLFYAMGRDRAIGEPLLKVGGRLVAFIPVRKGETLDECLPELQAREEAGLVMECEGREQVLNDILSRWLVSFLCVS